MQKLQIIDPLIQGRPAPSPAQRTQNSTTHREHLKHQEYEHLTDLIRLGEIHTAHRLAAKSPHWAITNNTITPKTETISD